MIFSVMKLISVHLSLLETTIIAVVIFVSDVVVDVVAVNIIVVFQTVVVLVVKC